MTNEIPGASAYPSVISELQKPSPSQIIELFELEFSQSLHNSSDIYRFHAGLNATGLTQPVVFAGKTYAPFPIEAEGFEYNSKGTLPRPVIRVSNALSSISALLLSVNYKSPGNDLCGAKLTRIRTLARFLDHANFAGGVNPYGQPDPEAIMPLEIYYVDRKVVENRTLVEFELASSFDLAGVRAPKRQCMSNLCPWVYRSAECGYTGTVYFNENDTAVTLVAATNFTAGNASLNAGQVLNTGQSITSSNGWYRSVIEPDGNFVTYSKNGTPVWFTNTSGQSISTYVQVFNDNFGVLKLTSPATLIWSSSLNSRVFTSISIVGYLPEGTNFYGRNVTFSVELFGEITYDSYNGVWKNNLNQTVAENDYRTIQYTFTRPLRSLTVNITAQAKVFNYDKYSFYNGNLFYQITSISHVSNTGTWGDDQLFYAYTNNGVSDTNPFKQTDYITYTTIAAQFRVLSTGPTVARLTQENNGALKLYDSGSAVLWTSGFSSSKEPLVGGGSNDPAADVCGKRLTSCEARFGQNNPLPFGGFPGLGNLY